MSDDETVQLEQLRLLQFMAPDVRRVVAASFVPVEYPFGAVIVREGEPADAVYAIATGRARVATAADDGTEVTLTVLGPGDTFGEVGLLRNARRTATVRASTAVTAMRLDGAVFHALVDTDERIRADLELHVRRLLLRDFLQLRTRFGDLPSELVRELLRALTPVDVSAHDVVIREGDPAGPLYVVEEGRLRVHASASGGRDVAYLRPGDVFGERTLFAGEPRAATVEAVTDARLLELSATGIERLLEEPAFRRCVEELVETYDYRALARVPLDFADEILPAAVERVPAQPAEYEPEEAGVRDGAPADVPATAFLPEPSKRRRIRRFPHIYQVDETDCGAACLAMVMRHVGHPVSLARAREVSRTTVEGASLRGIADGARQLGLEARTVKVSRRNLDRLPLPAICHVDGNHWVTVYDVRRGRVRVSDPALGLRRLPREEFESRWTGFTVVPTPTPGLVAAPERRRVGAWLRPFVRRHSRSLTLAGVLALVVASLEMAIPVFGQVVVDRVLPDGDVDLLRTLLLGLAGTVVAISAVSFANRYLLSRVAVRVDAETLDHLAARMLALPLTYFQARRAGEIQRRLAALRQVRSTAVHDGLVGLTAVTQLVVAIALMLAYSPLLALIFLAAAPVYAALMVFAARRIRPLADNLDESFARYHSRQTDAIRGIETVKAMGAEDALRKDLVREFDGLAERQFRSDLASMSYEAGVRVVTFVSLAVFLWLGTGRVLAGALTVGEFVAFNALVALAGNAIRLLLFLWDDLQVVTILLDRLNDVVEADPEQGSDRSHLRPVPTVSGHVQIEALTVRYGGPGSAPILEGVSFEVQPGTTVAIVGRSGSGKTTLARCLAGLVEPAGGRILFDGIDASTLDRRQLRRHIGFLPQDTFLFADTIARNIAFGDEDPDQSRVEWAAKVANAHDFVMRLPLGYKTKVGETGVLLSGGQRQRIALARAVYRRPAVLILDEATSNLDTESERAVQENLDRLLEGVTSFVIAHRLSTIRHADLVLVLERGRLVECGTHAELVARHGIYFFLTSQQLDM